MVLLVATFIWAVLVMMNFGRGLKVQCSSDAFPGCCPLLSGQSSVKEQRKQ